MHVDELLRIRSAEIVERAAESLRRTHLEHYDREDAEANRRRLERLLALTAQALRERRATALVHHAEELARERHAAGYALGEVQTAFNVLEEAIWEAVLAQVPLPEQAEALGLVSTVLGLAKDALGRSFVSLASRRRVPSLDLRALFR
jgi:hypothetical protein